MVHTCSNILDGVNLWLVSKVPLHCYFLNMDAKAPYELIKVLDQCPDVATNFLDEVNKCVDVTTNLQTRLISIQR